MCVNSFFLRSKLLWICEQNLLKETKVIFSKWSNWHFTWARELGLLAQQQANSFSKGHGVACWWFAVERYLRAGQGHIKDACRIQIIPFIQNWQPQLWVKAVVLMQMAMITVSNYGKVNCGRARGWVGHSQLQVFELVLGKVESGVWRKGNWVKQGVPNPFLGWRLVGFLSLSHI